MGQRSSRNACVKRTAIRGKALQIATNGMPSRRLNFETPAGFHMTTDNRPSEPLHRTSDAERAFRDRGLPLPNPRFDSHPRD